MKVLVVNTSSGPLVASVKEPIKCMELLTDSHGEHYDRVVAEKGLQDLDMINFPSYLENFINEDIKLEEVEE